MQDGLVRTDAEIAEATGLPHNKASGARATLWEQGLVERVEKDEFNPRLRWRICPPERQEQARLAYRDNTEQRRLASLRKRGPGEQANIVVHLLSDDRVNEAVLAQLERGREWRRARARANDVRADIDAQRRARRSELRRAEQEADAKLDFLTQLNYLRETIDALFVMRRFIEDEERRAAEGTQRRITDHDWISLGHNVGEVLAVAQVLFAEIHDLAGTPITSCPLCGERLHSAAVHIGEGYVDADAVEDDAEMSDNSRSFQS